MMTLSSLWEQSRLAVPRLLAGRSRLGILLTVALLGAAYPAWAAPRVIDTIPFPSGNYGISNPSLSAYIEDTGELYLVGYSPAYLKYVVLVMDPIQKKKIATIPGFGYAIRMKADPLRKRVYVLQYGSMVSIDTVSRTILKQAPLWPIYLTDIDVDSVTGRIWSAGGRYVGGVWKNQLLEMDPASLAVTRTIDLPDSFSPGALAVDSARRRVFIGGKAGRAEIQMVSLSSYTVEGKVVLPQASNTWTWIRSMALDPRDGTVYLGDYGLSRIWVLKEPYNHSSVGFVGSVWNPWTLTLDTTSDRLYVASWYEMSVVDIVQKKVVAKPLVGVGNASLAVSSKHGRYFVANYSYSKLHVLDQASNGLLESIDLKPMTPYGITVDSATQRAYVTGGYGGNLFSLDLNTRTIVKNLATNSYSAGRLALNKRGNKAYYVTVWGDYYIGQFDLATESLLPSISYPNLAWGIDVDERLNRFFGSSHCPSYFNAVDAATNKLLSQVWYDGYPMGVAANEKTGRVYTATYYRQSVGVFDSVSNQLLTTIPVGFYPREVAVNEGTNRIYITNYGSDSLSVIDGNKDIVVGTLKVGRYPQGVAVKRRGNRAYVVNTGGNTLTVVDGKLSIVATLPVGNLPQQVSVDESRDLVYVTNQADGTVTVIEDIPEPWELVGDTVPPHITHTPVPDNQPDSQPVVLQANVTDNIAVATVTLTYWEPGVARYYTVGMRNKGGTLYEASIPSSFLVNLYTKKVSYFIDATDWEANTPPTGQTPGTPETPNTFAVLDVTPPLAPIKFRAGTTQDGKGRLEWRPSPSRDLGGYVVYSDNGAGTVDYISPVAAVSSSTLVWVSPVALKDLLPIRYVVRARDTGGNEEKNTLARFAEKRLSSWSKVTPLPAPRFGYSSLVKENRAYVIGGGVMSDWYGRDTVWHSTRDVTGSLGPWNSATPLPERRYLPISVEANGRLYVLGGLADRTLWTIRNTVFHAPIGSDGSLGVWQTATPLPKGLFAHAALAARGYVYVVGGLNSSYQFESAIWRSQVGLDGSLGTWQQVGVLPRPMSLQGHVLHQGRLYVIGGYGSSPSGSILQETFSVPLNPDGSLGTWRTERPLPLPRVPYSTTLVDGKIILSGGFDWEGNYTQDDSWYAQIQADGTLGEWTGVTILPEDHQLHHLLAISRDIYVPGGMKWVLTNSYWLYGYDFSTVLRATLLGDAPPVKVTGLSVSATSEGTSLKLAWKPNPEPDVVSYKVYRGGQFLVQVATTSYLDTGLSNGTTYTYQVSAVDQAGQEGEKSDPVSGVLTDQTAPVSRISSPVDGAFLGRFGLILGTASDSGSGVQEVQVSIQEPTTSYGWTSRAALPTGRNMPSGGVVNGIWYVLGGMGAGAILSTVEAYDPAADSWTVKAPMPTARYGAGVGVAGGILYAVGGWDGKNNVATVEAYDPATNSWTAKAPMPTPRSSAGVAVINGVLYAVGGFQGSGTGLATLEAYDPATNTWTSKAPMPTGRSNHSVAALNGILYAVGGRDATGKVLNTIEAYDPLTNTWASKAPMPTARYGLEAQALGGQLHAVGGGAGFQVYGTVEAYDPASNSWTTKASMPTSRFLFASGQIQSVLYAAGGSGSVSSYLTVHEAYAPSGSGGSVWYAATGRESWGLAPPIVLADGTTYRATSRAKDQAGNLEIPSSSVRFIWDGSPPVTSLKLEGTSGLNGYFVSPVTATLTAQDPVSGVEKTFFRIDEGALQDYPGLLILGDGLHTLEFYSKDRAGNSEAPKSQKISVDASLPSSAISHTLDGSVHSSFPVISGTASDGLSGVLQVELNYKNVSTSQWWDGQKWQGQQVWLLAQGTAAWTYPSLPDSAGTDGPYSVSSRATDQAGNLGPESAAVLFRLDLPPSKVLDLAVSAPVEAGSLKLAWSSNPESDIASYKVYRGGQFLVQVATTSYLDTGLLIGTTYTYQVSAVDQAGQEGEKSDPVSGTPKDLVAPVSRILNPFYGVFVRSLDSIQGTASDVGSGVSEVQVSIHEPGAGPVWQTALGTATWSWSPSGSFQASLVEGKTYLALSRAKDQAGNLEVPTSSSSFVMDFSLPTTDVALQGVPGPNGYFASSVTATLTAQDSISGVAQTYWRLDGGSWLSYTSAIVIGPGTHVLEFYSVDRVGNVEVPKSRTVQVDLPPGKVSGLKVQAPPEGGKLELSWTGSSEPDVVNYRIYRDGMLLVSVAASTYLNSGLVPGKIYTYQVSAVDQAGQEGEKSDPVSGVPNLPPLLAAPQVQYTHWAFGNCRQEMDRQFNWKGLSGAEVRSYRVYVQNPGEAGFHLEWEEPADFSGLGKWTFYPASSTYMGGDAAASLFSLNHRRSLADWGAGTYRLYVTAVDTYGRDGLASSVVLMTMAGLADVLGVSGDPLTAQWKGPLDAKSGKVELMVCYPQNSPYGEKILLDTTATSSTLSPISFQTGVPYYLEMAKRLPGDPSTGNTISPSRSLFAFVYSPDLKPPVSWILSPADGSVLNVTTVLVSGTAEDQGLSGVTRVEVGLWDLGDGTQKWILADGTSAFQFSLQGLLDGRSYKVASRAQDGKGNLEVPTRFVQFQIDLLPPAVTGLQAALGPSGDSAVLSWSPVTAPDFSGYRIYSSTGLVATTSATSFESLDLKFQATYTYSVSAVDLAGQEGPKTAVTFTTGTDGAATAWIRVPKDGKRIWGNAVTLLAGASDGASKVVFQYQREEETVWRSISSADAKPPYAVYWNVSDGAIARGAYRLRAVAYDSKGLPDLNPPSVRVTVDDANADIVEDGNPEVDPNVEHRKIERVAQNASEEVIILDGTQVLIPQGTVSQEEKIRIKVVHPSKAPAPKSSEAVLSAAGVFREFTFESGTKQFNGKLVLTLPVPDEDGDGIVDGTRIRVSSLKVYYYSESERRWLSVGSQATAQLAAQGTGTGAGAGSQSISVEVDHFTLFGLFEELQPSAALELGEVYSFPNPARSGQRPTLHVEVGKADRLEIRIYDVSGDLVHSTEITSPPSVVDGKYAYRYAWETSAVPSGVYIFVVQARLGAERSVKAKGRLALIK